jgi:hypothetical protein
MRSKLQGQIANWEVRTWDVVTVVVMMMVAVIGAVWMVHLG